MGSKFGRFSGRAWLTFLAVGWLLIAYASLEYFQPGRLAPFVIERMPLRFETLWRNSLLVHVAAAVVSFPLCLLLATGWLQRRVRLHRPIGRVAALVVLLALVPSGFVLAFEAKGGAPSTIGFLLSGIIVLVAMVHGVGAARRHDPRAHQRAMRHVLAQMSVAVTSRAMLIGFDLAGVEPTLGYVAALWIPVVGSALVAEWMHAPLIRGLESRQLASVVPLERSPS